MQRPFQVTYGTGAVAGNIVTDNVVIAGLSLKGHTFGTAQQETQDFADNSIPFDGVMGLAQSVCGISPFTFTLSCPHDKFLDAFETEDVNTSRSGDEEQSDQRCHHILQARLER